METSKTDHYEKLWEKQSTSEYIGNGFLLLVLLTTNEEAICYTLGYFFFFISSNNCPQVSKLFIVQIHSKKKHCHYLIQRQFGGLNTFVKVIAMKRHLFLRSSTRWKGPLLQSQTAKRAASCHFL